MACTASTRCDFSAPVGPVNNWGLGSGDAYIDAGEALIVIWEASDRICGKRLRPLVPVLVEAMERHGHLELAPEVRAGLLTMSAATIDRALREVRKAGRRTKALCATFSGDPAQRSGANV